MSGAPRPPAGTTPSGGVPPPPDPSVADSAATEPVPGATAAGRAGAAGAAGGSHSDVRARIAERRRRYRERSPLYRTGVVIAGFVITLAGLVMTGPVPGPGIVVIPVGLALLALQFDWAERLLVKAVDYAENQKRRARESTPAQRWATGIAVAVGIALFVVAAVLWDIPLLPV